MERSGQFGDAIDAANLPSKKELWSEAQRVWASEWCIYVKFGGTRPPRKPPL